MVSGGLVVGSNQVFVDINRIWAIIASTTAIVLLTFTLADQGPRILISLLL